MCGGDVYGRTELLERGWLRSGSFLYLPSNDRTCCPNIAIRLDATKFAASASQRKVLRRFRSYVTGSRSAGAKGADGRSTQARDGAAAAAVDVEAAGRVARMRTSLLAAVQEARVASRANGDAVALSEVPGWSDDLFTVSGCGCLTLTGPTPP